MNSVRSADVLPKENGLALKKSVVWIASVLTTLVVVSAILVFSPSNQNKDRTLVDGKLAVEDATAALKALTPTQRDALVAREKARLRAEPLDKSSLNNLSLLEFLAGNNVAAEQLLLNAANRSLRDTQSQVFAVQYYAQQQKFSDAMLHLDGLLRAKPTLIDDLFRIMTQIMSTKPGMSALVSVLNQQPPWRQIFMAKLTAEDKKAQYVFALLSEIKKSGADVSERELTAVINQQYQEGEYERAYFIWLDSLNDSELRKAALIFDGNFDLQPKNQFFDWTIYQPKNAEINIAPRPGQDENRNLRLDFFASSGHFDHVRQSMLLSPGNYRLDGEFMSSNLQTDGGLVWSIGCAGTGTELNRSVPFKTDSQWTSFGFDFEVPNQNCSTQVLHLTNPGRAVLDTKITGQMNFDSFVISRRTSE